MSTFTGVARIVGTVVWRIPRIVVLAVSTKSSLGRGQRRAAEAFRKTLIGQGLPAALAAELAQEYPKLEFRDVISGLSHRRAGGSKIQDDE